VKAPGFWTGNRSTLVLFVLVAGIIVYLTQTVSGTRIENDATWFTVWQHQVTHLGLIRAYARANLIAVYPRLRPINYPPLYLYLLKYVPLPAIPLGFLLSMVILLLFYRKVKLFDVVVFLAMPITFFDLVIVGQIDYLLIFMVIASVLLVEADRPIPAGILAGLALTLKEEAVVFLPVFAALALRERRYAYSLLAAFTAVLAPLAGNLTLILKVSYLNNVGLYQYLTMNGPNLWSLFAASLAQRDTVYIRYAGYLLSALWAVFMFRRYRTGGDWLAFGYAMAVGFLFWPTQSQMRYEVYPFAFAFYLWKVRGRREFILPAYFFGITGGLYLALEIFRVNPLVELAFLKACALVTAGIVYRVARGRLSGLPDGGGETPGRLLSRVTARVTRRDWAQNPDG
jgi:hypothetical protein